MAREARGCIFPLVSFPKCPIIVDRYPSADAAAVPTTRAVEGPGEVGLTAFRFARKRRWSSEFRYTRLGGGGVPVTTGHPDVIR